MEAAQMAEQALVCRAQGGDTEAFGELVRIYRRRAVSVAYRLLGNVEDASDASQDAFVRAYRSLSQLDDAARFGGWLMRTVCNCALNFRRSRKLRAVASLDDTPLAAEEVRDPHTGQRLSGNAGETPLSAELHGAVGEAIEQLPEKQRLALILFSVEGMPQKQVAEVLDCSVELVKWNVFQARKKLKEMLAEYL